jgi:hypothetical protein
MSNITEIGAYQCTDGTIFADEKSAADHQQGIQAGLLLKLINNIMPEREKNILTANDWYRVQLNVVERTNNEDLKRILGKLHDAL